MRFQIIKGLILVSAVLAVGCGGPVEESSPPLDATTEATAELNGDVQPMCLKAPQATLWIPAERLTQFRVVWPEAKLEPEIAPLAGFTGFGAARRAVRGSGEVLVAAPAAPAARDHDAAGRHQELVQLFAALPIVHDRADRDADLEVAPALAVAVFAFAVCAPFGAMHALRPEIVECAEPRIRHEQHPRL